MNTAWPIHNDRPKYEVQERRAIERHNDVTIDSRNVRRLKLLRLKLIRETEGYLSNPFNVTWARAG